MQLGRQIAAPGRTQQPRSLIAAAQTSSRAARPIRSRVATEAAKKGGAKDKKGAQKKGGGALEGLLKKKAEAAGAGMAADEPATPAQARQRLRAHPWRLRHVGAHAACAQACTPPPVAPCARPLRSAHANVCASHAPRPDAHPAPMRSMPTPSSTCCCWGYAPATGRRTASERARPRGRRAPSAGGAAHIPPRGIGDGGARATAAAGSAPPRCQQVRVILIPVPARPLSPTPYPHLFPPWQGT